MKTIGGILTALLALFCGGCSLFFAYSELSSSEQYGLYIFWGPSLLIAVLLAFAAYRLLR